jgi:hypothetical protein
MPPRTPRKVTIRLASDCGSDLFHQHCAFQFSIDNRWIPPTEPLITENAPERVPGPQRSRSPNVSTRTTSKKIMEAFRAAGVRVEPPPLRGEEAPRQDGIDACEFDIWIDDKRFDYGMSNIDGPHLSTQVDMSIKVHPMHSHREIPWVFLVPLKPHGIWLASGYARRNVRGWPAPPLDLPERGGRNWRGITLPKKEIPIGNHGGARDYQIVGAQPPRPLVWRTLPGRASRQRSTRVS